MCSNSAKTFLLESDGNVFSSFLASLLLLVWNLMATNLQIVKHHPHEVGRERQVFVDFFCNPERLRNQVRELNEVRELNTRVKARPD